LEAGFVERFINLRYLKTPLRLEKPFSVKTFASLGVLHRNSTGACINAGKILPMCMKTCPESGTENFSSEYSGVLFSQHVSFMFQNLADTDNSRYLLAQHLRDARQPGHVIFSAAANQR